MEQTFQILQVKTAAVKEVFPLMRTKEGSALCWSVSQVKSSVPFFLRCRFALHAFIACVTGIL